MGKGQHARSMRLVIHCVLEQLENIQRDSGESRTCIVQKNDNGWYFVVYETSLMPFLDDNIHEDNDSSTLLHSFSKLEGKECLVSDGFKKEVHIPRKRERLEISINRLTD